MMIRYLLLGFSLVISSGCVAIEKPHTLPISSEVKQLLTQEMQLLEKGMQHLFSSIITADWAETIKLSKQIQASFILKQALSPEQRAELHHHLPKPFIELDHSFHQYAGLLADAATAKNQDIVNFYFSKMLGRCTECHSKYATEKFPEFSVKKHHH